MEGKGVLFKRFADIDVFDIELETHDPDEIIRTVADEFDGYVFATGGDSFAIAFARGSQAVDAARASLRLREKRSSS